MDVNNVSVFFIMNKTVLFYSFNMTHADEISLQHTVCGQKYRTTEYKVSLSLVHILT